MLKFNLNLIVLVLILKSSFGVPLLDNNENLKDDTLRKIAKGITEKLHKDVDPCKSIKSYVSGNDTSIPDFGTINFEKHKDVDNLFKELEKNSESLTTTEVKLKNFLLSCKNQNFKEQVENLSIAKAMGGWPLYTPDWNADNFDWVRSNIELNKYGLYTVLFISYRDNKLSKSDEEEKIVTLKVLSGSVGDVSSIKKFFEVFDLTSEGYDINEFVNEIVKFDEKLSQYEQLKDDVFDFSELKREIPEFDWDKYFELYYEEKLENLPKFKVSTIPLDKFKELLDLIQKNKKTFANYLMWKMLQSLTGSSTPDKTLYWVDCNVVSHLTPIAVKVITKERIPDGRIDTKLYYDVHREYEKVIDNLPHSTNTIVYKLQKQNIKDILNAVENHEILLNNEEFDSYYSELEIVSNNYLQNYYNIQRDIIRKHLKGSKLIENDIQNRLYYIQNYPSVVYFESFQYFYSEVFDLDAKDKFFDCVKNKFNEEDDIIFSDNSFFYDELVILIFNAYKSWMEENKDINEKENEILSEFDLNNEKLFLLLETSTEYYGDDSDFKGKKITSMIYNCPKESYMSCNLI